MADRISRRGFLYAGATSAALLCLGGIGKTGLHDTVYLRPPGASEEEVFLAACNRCGRCIQICPMHTIQALPLSFHIAAAGTPSVFFGHTWCDFCGKCWEACPTGALSASAPSTGDIGLAKVISDACVAWKWSGCTICVDVCPVPEAISMDENGRPVVDEARCCGCGMCEWQCPASSLRSYDVDAAERGICVVARKSLAAKTEGAITTARLSEGRNISAASG